MRRLTWNRYCRSYVPHGLILSFAGRSSAAILAKWLDCYATQFTLTHSTVLLFILQRCRGEGGMRPMTKANLLDAPRSTASGGVAEVS